MPVRDEKRLFMNWLLFLATPSSWPSWLVSYSDFLGDLLLLDVGLPSGSYSLDAAGLLNGPVVLIFIVWFNFFKESFIGLFLSLGGNCTVILLLIPSGDGEFIMCSLSKNYLGVNGEISGSFFGADWSIKFNFRLSSRFSTCRLLLSNTCTGLSVLYNFFSSEVYIPLISEFNGL